MIKSSSFTGILNPLANLDHKVDLSTLGIDFDFKRSLEPLESNISMTSAFTFFHGEYPIRLKNESDDQFKDRKNTWFSTGLQLVHSQESSMFPLPGHRFIREELVNDPILRNCYGQRGGFAHDRYSSNNFPPMLTTTSQRQRTFESVPLCFVIYMVSNMLASSDVTRHKLAQFENGKRPVPKLLNELIKSNRSSNCGNFNIKPTSTGLPAHVVSEFDLHGTVFDLDFLKSDSGLLAIFDFFSRLAQYPDIYIPMENYQHIDLNAGNTTTLNAISVESVEDKFSSSVSQSFGSPLIKERGVSSGPIKVIKISPSDTRQPVVVKLLPGHAYGSSCNGVHVTDSYLFSRKLINNDKSTLYVGQFSGSLIPTGMTQQYALYVVKRASFQLENKPSGKDPSTKTPPQPPVNGKASPVFKKKQPSSPLNNGNDELRSFISVILQLVQNKYIKPMFAEKLLTKLCFN